MTRTTSKFAAWLIPIVVVFLAVVYFITRDVRTIVTLMVFTSPAELGLATPLVMIAAIARAARSGILVKGGVYLESLANAVESGAEPPVHIAVDGRLAGVMFIADTLRPGARETLAKLKATGVKRIVMLTGDNAAITQAVATALGVDEVHADLLPEDKVSAIAELQRQGHRVAMIGDGINDAPALALADVGIAMRGGGTQATLEAAEVALMTDDLAKIVTVRAIAQRAYRTSQENLFVGVVHLCGISAALRGWIGPIQAAILH